MAVLYGSTTSSRAIASDSASFFTPSLTIGIVITAAVLLTVIITITVNLCALRWHTGNAQDDLERQDVKTGSYSPVWSSFAGPLSRPSSRQAQHVLPLPVLQILPHHRPRRQRLRDALMFWRMPQHSAPKTKLDVEAQVREETLSIESAESVGLWQRFLSSFRRAAVIPEIVVIHPFDVSHFDDPSSATVSPISSPGSIVSELASPMPLTPILASSSFPAVVFLARAELQSGAVPAHAGPVEVMVTKPALPTQVGLGIIYAGLMSTASSAADIFYDASEFCWDLDVPHCASIKRSVSLRNLELPVDGQPPGFLTVTRVGGLAPSRSAGFVVPSRSSIRFGTFVEALRCEAAARIASRDSVYLDCTLTPSMSVDFDRTLTPSKLVDCDCTLIPSVSADFCVPSRSSKRFDVFVKGLRCEAAARIAASDSVYFDRPASHWNPGLA